MSWPQGRYVGEGFDDARLDTNAGRRHRLHPRKNDVLLFDYVDRKVPMHLRMFEKRRRTYRAIGYLRARRTSIRCAESKPAIIGFKGSLDPAPPKPQRPVTTSYVGWRSSWRSNMLRPVKLVDEINAIRAGLRELGDVSSRLAVSFTRLAPQLADAASADSRPRRRKPRITVARRAQLKLQGRYLGYMRGLKPRQKARVRKLRERKGVRAAIAAAKRMRNK